MPDWNHESTCFEKTDRDFHVFKCSAVASDTSALARIMRFNF